MRTAATRARPRCGHGHAGGHHGEILQGAFLDETGQPCLGLVTLPIAGIGTHAEFVPWPHAPSELIAVEPGDKTKAVLAATLAIRECAALAGGSACGGRLRLVSDIPVGLGMGSSSSDVIATIRAVAASFGIELPSLVIARLAVAAEQASDPLMLDSRPLLFAQRQGRVLEVLGDTLPPTVVVGCTTGGAKPVETVDVPADVYCDEDVRGFAMLRAALRQAITTGDVELLGQVSTESARRHQRVLGKDELDTLIDIAALAGGVGVQVAHSGNVAGLLFDPRAHDLPCRLRRCVRALNDTGIAVSRLFRTHSPSGRPGAIPSGGKEPDHGRPHRGLDRPPRPGPGRRWPHLPAL